MSSEIAIKVESLSKCYQIYDQPRDRLKQFLFPLIQRLFRQAPKNYYREFWALRDVSFEIKKGETVGIIGKNGAGKSTLLQILTGTLAPSAGEVQVNGRLAALLELGSGFNPEFTGRENIYLNGTIIGMTHDEVDARLDKILAFADIGDFIDQPVKTYSSGMYVRLAFAIQANIDPEILIVDEALAVGDAYFVHKCMLRFHELQKAGTTIVFVSHDATAVRNLCSRSVWLSDGGIKEAGASEKVVDAYLAHLFGHKVVASDLEWDASMVPNKQSASLEFGIEASIPNIDRRLGDQRSKIIGVGLYDEEMRRITSSYNNKVVILRISIVNCSLDADTSLSVGYIIRNSRGQDIASTNNQVEGSPIKFGSMSRHLTVKMLITLPYLHPGSYAFTVSTGYVGDDGEIKIADRVDNAIALDVASKKNIHVLMSLHTEIVVEK